MRRRFLWTLGFAFLAAVALAGSAGADWGATQIQVYCYAGDRNDNEYLGTVDVYESAKAASFCNMLYGDCHSNCTGCYTNEEAREICINSSGAAYYF